MPPRVEEMRLSEAGVISISGIGANGPAATRAGAPRRPSGRRAFPRRSSILPDGVAGKTLSKSTIGRPSDAVIQPRGRSGCRSAACRARRGSAASTASSISSASLALKHGLVKAEPRGEPAEDLGVRQRFAQRRDDRFCPLQPVMAIGGVEVGVFEVRRRRQDDVAMRHAFGHRHVDADREDVIARQAAAHAVLVGMHDDRVVVVDEQRAQRRVDVVLDQVPTDVDQIERARARRRQVRPLQFGRASSERRYRRRARCRCLCRACRAVPARRSRRGCRCRRCGRAPVRCRAP